MQWKFWKKKEKFELIFSYEDDKLNLKIDWPNPNNQRDLLNIVNNIIGTIEGIKTGLADSLIIQAIAKTAALKNDHYTGNCILSTLKTFMNQKNMPIVLPSQVFHIPTQ